MAPTTRTALIPTLLILIFLESSTGTQEPSQGLENTNIFLSMAWQVANHIQPDSRCYVCGLMPFTASEGLPLMALPASDCDTCHLMHIPLSPSGPRSKCNSIPKMRSLHCSPGHAENCYRCPNAPKPVPIQMIPKPFPWCVQNDGNVTVGKSACVRTYKWDSEETSAAFKSLESESDYCLRSAGQLRLSALARRTAQCSISSPEGMYWVCGSLAYPYLPVDYNGRCGLAYVIPAMRVAHSLPMKSQRKPQINKRKRRGVSDIYGTHKQSTLKNVLGPLLPFYGIMSALDQIADLSRAVEDLANSTARALMLISSELASVRLLALQNRAALDYLLSAQGGTCAIIGTECCTFVPDHNATVNDIIDHLHQTSAAVHQQGGSFFDLFRTPYGWNVYVIAKWVVVFVAFLVFMSLFVSCVRNLLCRFNYTKI